SDDGKKYTFTLNKNAKWSNGEPVTAKDFVFSWKRAVDKNTAAEYAYIMFDVKNAKAINEGKAASIMNGPWAFQAMEKNGIDYGVAPMPKLPNGQPMKTFVGVKGWHVTSFSKQNDLATKFTEWVTNEENAKIRFEKTKEIPPVKSVMEDPIIKDNEAAKAVATQSENGIPMPNIPEMQEVWKPAGDALQLVVTDKEAPKAALDSAVKQIKGNIEANHNKKK
ncbi:extracellular solute-binding protein, partial [Bacillus toyonensis]|uniref:extracellular solute-binding protein n=1 Tax=Bacillus toyonensis TaxID=155322 RepID=UPI002FFE5F7A